jgi:ribosomal protein L7Ae-like RNA K-turn-binding protein
MEAVKGAAGRAKLIVTANDAGNSVKREAERLNSQHIMLAHNKEELGRAVGRKTCAIAALTDKEFSRGLSEALMEQLL